MNPNTFEQPGLSLPEPMPIGEKQDHIEKQQVSSPEVSNAPQNFTGIALSPPALPTLPKDNPSPQFAAQNNHGAGAMPMAADDSDLIEKEWVSKAKEIVEKTKEDPHEQSREISYLKADYLKKRYNKDIKVSEH